MPKSREHKNARDRSRRALKKKAKTFKIRKSSGDLVAIQISARLKKGVPKKMLTAKLLEAMIRHKAETSRGEWNGTYVVGAHEGEDPTGIKLSIIRWKNPDRLASEDQGWRYADPDSPSEQADAWGSLRRIIRDANLSVRLNR
jgi:hypothetical protein